MTDLRRHWAVFFVLAAISLSFAWHSLLQTFALAWHNDEYTHILLVLPLATILSCMKWKLDRNTCSWGFWGGLALLAIAVISAVAAGYRSHSLDPDVLLAFVMLALVVWWIGSFLFCFGTGAAKALLFPILLLFGLVPLPGMVLDRIIAALQMGSAWSAHVLFSLSGVPVVQHGVFVTIPDLTIQVAQECSSIRSSSMLLVTTIAVAEILLRSPWRKTLLIALAIPLSVAKNGLRIFVIAMLGTRVDPDYLTGSLHREGGILFFALALMAVFAALALLQRGETNRVRASPQRPRVATMGN